ncbi:MAG: GNAT family N-acetyltransferase [Halohasta sp.]
MARTRQSAEEYQVRPYRPGDREKFCSLYETVWGRRKDADWFAWRFEANPYRDGVQMVVAERDGELVGAEPLLAFRLRIDGSVHEVYQPVDWIVAPDHRRRGLFTRMTERVLDRFLPEVSLFVNFPNELLLPGLKKFGWRTVGPVGCRYRVQDTRPFVERANAEPLPAAARTAANVGAPLVRAGLDVLDRLSSPPEITVERSSEVPVDVIRGLYASAQPRASHFVRDREFLRWRFANPNWETTSYVAARDGETVASIVTATDTTPHCTLTRLLDIQPMCQRDADPAAFEAALAAVVDDATDADLICGPTGYCPAVFRRYGFYRDDTFPLSTVSSTTTHAIRTPDDGHLSTDLTDPAAWHLTIGDLDVG